MPDTPTGMPGDLGMPVLAPLYADGMPLTALGTALSGSGGPGGASRFWSTPPRYPADPTREALEITLGAPATVNTVTVQIPRFPHTTWLQAWNDRLSGWVTLTDAAGNAATATVTDSLPPVVAAGVNSAARRHPQHFGAGHWIPQKFEFTPVTCTRLRLVQARVPSAAAPVGPTGKPVAYSLGARDLVAGYSTGVPGGAPLRTGAFAAAADILGSAAVHTVRRADAWGLPIGRTWRSAPQPVAAAVVSLYADCRNALGRPQVVDRLSLDPVTSGVSMCVYYSTDTPVKDVFPAADAPLGASVVPSAANPTATAAGLVFTGTACYLDIAANAIGYDPGVPFAWGLILAPAYASTAPGPYTVLDAGSFKITYRAGAFTAALGSARATAGAVFAAGARLAIGVLFDGRTLTVNCAGTVSSATIGTVPTIARTASIRVAGALGATPATSAMTLASAVLWQCAAATAAAGLAAWTADPHSVLDLPTFAAGPHPSDGTVLRLDPRDADADSPFGVRGGPGIDVNAAHWLPAARDAVARAGSLPLPPMLASLIKVEFTNLAAAPFETSAAVPVSTALADPARQHLAAISSPGTADAGTAVTAATGSAFFSDMRRLPSASAQAVSPTEALYAPDPRVASRIDDGPGFGFTPWQMQGQPVAPRGAGTHTGTAVDAVLNRRAAFFVALRSLALGRDGAGAAPRDYDRLVESMQDGVLLGPTGTATGWVLDSGRLVTPVQTRGRRTAVSAAFLTHNPVVALQFAAGASEPGQVLPDPDFTAPTLAAWSPVGDAALSVDGGYASSVGHAVRTVRGGGSFGGIGSASSFSPGRTGRLHAAVRVYAPNALSSPLILSLVNADGTVLATSSATATAGQVIRFTCTLNLDTPLAPGADTWGIYDAHGPYSGLVALGSYGAVSGAGAWVRGVTAQLTQTGTDADVFYVDSLAMFYDPITWRVSRDGGATWYPVADIRNNPAGVLVFPPLTGVGTSLMWRADCDSPGVSVSAVALRPWYQLRAGGVRPAPPGVPAGPLLSPADHYGPIEDDPYWQAWPGPVPKGWWAAGRPHH